MFKVLSFQEPHDVGNGKYLCDYLLEFPSYHLQHGE